MASAAPARADGVLDYLESYRVGADYSAAVGAINVAYKTTSELPLNPNKCKSSGGDGYRCIAALPLDPTPTPGLFFEQPLERTGFWHFDYDFALAFRTFRTKGEGFESADDVAPAGTLSAPVKHMQLTLVGANTDGYVELGVTPGGWYPDLIFELGLGLQTLYGTVRINDTTLRDRIFLNSLLRSEVDLTVFHFAEAGSVYVFFSVEGGGANLGSVSVDGARSFQFDFVRNTAGLAVLADWP